MAGADSSGSMGMGGGVVAGGACALPAACARDDGAGFFAATGVLRTASVEANVRDVRVTAAAGFLAFATSGWCAAACFGATGAETAATAAVATTAAVVLILIAAAPPPPSSVFAQAIAPPASAPRRSRFFHVSASCSRP